MREHAQHVLEGSTQRELHGVGSNGWVCCCLTYLVSSHGSLSRPQHPKNETLHDALLHAESLGDVAKQNVASLKHFSSLSVLINASASAQLGHVVSWNATMNRTG
jgi:hypothetical protein